MWSHPTHQENVRGLGSHPASQSHLGAFSHAQSHAILLVALTCASISLVAASLALRWFLLMRRSFRHRLILFLIISDSFKSIWYFVFPVVAITRGTVDSSSSFCQASGFLLSFSLESSDYAILMIALHTVLYVFRPPQTIGEGGLYPYRRWVYIPWICLPTLAASLAFVNPDEAYVTSGTFCYLPKRPFWYRLALAWIPRYLIFIFITTLYATIYVYVHMKFQGFNNLARGGSSFGSSPESRHRSTAADPNDREKATIVPAKTPARKLNRLFQSEQIKPVDVAANGPPRPQARAPWENSSFMSVGALQENDGVASTDFAPNFGSTSSEDTRVPTRNMSEQTDRITLAQDLRKASDVPTLGTNYTGETASTQASFNPAPAPVLAGSAVPVNTTRLAIRRQLRFLFIYPAVYLLMWTFPFASHCLMYSDYYTTHPPFWLSVVSTCMLALQGGVDSVVFSWRERPWRRVDEKSALSMTSITSHLNPTFLRRPKGRDHEGTKPSETSGGNPAAAEVSKRDSNWWEAEGRKRKDSVWMGTDLLSQIISRQTSAEVGLRTTPE